MDAAFPAGQSTAPRRYGDCHQYRRGTSPSLPADLVPTPESPPLDVRPTEHRSGRTATGCWQGSEVKGVFPRATWLSP